MSEPVIRVDGLGKRYRLGRLQSYRTVREDLTETMTRAWNRLMPWARSADSGPEEGASHIWALRHVSLEIRPGEVVGLIGRNGAGKTTLLKMLSRIVEPTEGQAMIHGRTNSLLEVGTGFHPELTGRENIFLNGAILGMQRAEIARKFDAIVDFAEVRPFIDTPVKRYSSGMFVRLAFAVAAHLEPDVLFVDEVLAVGDAAFQEKCLGRMSQASRAGWAVVFVSHNMEAVLRLCTRVVWLDQGRIMMDDTPQRSIGAYLEHIRHRQASADNGRVSLIEHPGRRKTLDGLVRLVSCVITADHGERGAVPSGGSCRIRLGYRTDTPLRGQRINFGVIFRGEGSGRLTSCWSQVASDDLDVLGTEGEVECVIHRLGLVPGRYILDIGCQVASAWSDMIYEAVMVDVVSGPFYASGRLPPADAGQCLMDYVWTKAETGVGAGTSAEER